MVLTTREPRRGGSEAQSVDVRPYHLYDAIGYLWRLRSLRFLAAAASIDFFATSAKLAWSAPFMIRLHDMIPVKPVRGSGLRQVSAELPASCSAVWRRNAWPERMPRGCCESLR
jgi:hypothetical protein